MSIISIICVWPKLISFLKVRGCGSLMIASSILNGCIDTQPTWKMLSVRLKMDIPMLASQESVKSALTNWYIMLCMIKKKIATGYLYFHEGLRQVGCTKVVSVKELDFFDIAYDGLNTSMPVYSKIVGMTATHSSHIGSDFMLHLVLISFT